MALNLSSIQHVNPPEGSEGMRTQVRKDDVLVCITGALTGNVALIDVDLPAAYVNQHVALLRPRAEKVLPRYFAFVLHSEMGKSQFKTSEYGGTKQGLSLDDVKSVIVPVPPLNEQRAIVTSLDAQLESLIAPMTAAARGISLVREYRNRLISDVVTGKCDVRGVSKVLLDEIQEPVAGVGMNGLDEDKETVDSSVEEAAEEAEA